MKPNKSTKILILFLTAILLCTSCGKEKDEAPPAAKATTMNLMKTKGTVNIDDRDGKQIEPVKNLKLYSGYEMFTQKTSYAWINLDRVKLAKMDQKSEIKIQKDEKRLEIHVNSGSLFFHVKQPLEDDETMNIHNSTMAVGIRGTCGWTVRNSDMHSQVYILEGKVTIQTKDGETAKVRAGQKADVTIDQNGKSKIVISKFTVKDIPKFVMKELRQDEDLPEKILEDSGLDVLNPDAEEEPAPEEEAENTERENEPEETNEADEEQQNEAEQELAYEAYDSVIEEYRNFAADIRNFASDPGNLDNYGNIDYNKWMTNYRDDYAQRYPNISDEYTYYINGGDNFYSAFYDLDANGIDELIIGHNSGSESIYPMSIHTFNGTEAVKREAILYELLGDGLLLGTGNGYISGRVYQLSRDGYTWEEITDSGIPSGIGIQVLDLSAHGGFLRDTLEWTALD